MTPRDRRALVEAAFLVAYSAAAVHDQHSKRGKWKSGEAGALYERMLRTASALCRIYERARKAA